MTGLSLKHRNVRAPHLVPVDSGEIIHKQVFRPCWLERKYRITDSCLGYHGDTGKKHRSSHLRLCIGTVRGLQGGPGGRAALVLQGDDEHLDGLHHQLLPLVRREQVVVGDSVTDGVVGANHVEQGGEEGEGMSG